MYSDFQFLAQTFSEQPCPQPTNGANSGPA